ncbi:MAG: peptidase S46 [Bacteroidetes bacterium GWF2_33_16]|nr:MAG: peptidase S46 [Bacteroidetes bacterium GWE2_32_14]OFY06576.1 MAG: peptidase S46 [Bacteroidetes bacterium GWF2_33_16]
MKKLIYFLLSLAMINSVHLRADEGMWIPLLLNNYTIADMQKNGLKLTADDIYSINKESIKDAIVIFGSGCTGELVSDQGLLLTNHHCGYEQIQNHSRIDNDYLTNGFWAMSKAEELPNPGLTVKFLVRIEDVTKQALNDIDNSMTQAERNKKIGENIQKLEEDAIKGTHYLASVRPFYYGNEYFLFVYEEFKDVRLVGAPPSSIGKFGGDTDNWMWPRHTGDFSVFRIYANKENKPADYSPVNVPYKPKKFLNVSMKGINEGDFTWVLGYPGGTEQYLTSDAIKLVSELRNPHKIKIRDKRLEIMNSYGDINDTIRIKYASKNARVSNSWKRWIGEINGLKRLDGINKKIEFEKEFTKWAENKPVYNGLLKEFSKNYNDIESYALAYDYWREAVNGIEIIDFAADFENLIEISENQFDSSLVLAEVTKLIKIASDFYKDYDIRVDKDVFKALLPMYFSGVSEDFYPSVYSIIQSEYNGDFTRYVEKLLRETVFNKPEKLDRLLSIFSSDRVGELKNDPVYVLFSSFSEVYKNKVSEKYIALSAKNDSLYNIYMNALREMQPQKKFYPDANFTMRVAYGKVKGYYPKDGVKYLHYTTLEGVIEKDNPAIYDYDIPNRLREIYKQSDYGVYAKDGTVPLCFIATNHTTGGNSGSPVLDANGSLIGLNFDRAWEGIASDMMYDPDFSRNVSLDIRYVLFIIDKYAGAKHLVDEMKVVR